MKRTSMLLPTAAALLAAALLPAALRAQTAVPAPPKKIEIFPVVVPLQPGMEKQADILTVAALKSIGASERYSSKAGSMSIHGVKPLNLEILKRGEDLFNEALAAYDQLDMATAIDKASRALEKYEMGAAFIQDYSAVTRILHFLGVCTTLNGDLEKSSELFLRAFTLDPAGKPDENMAPPEVMDVYQETVAGAANVGTGSLDVTSVPEGASVFLDGMPMGITPITINDVLVGRHFIKISKPGYQYFGSVLSVSSAKTKTLDGSLVSIPTVGRAIGEIEKLPALCAKNPASAGAALKTIVADLGVDQALVIVLSAPEGQVASLGFSIYDRIKGGFVAQRQGESPDLTNASLLEKGGDLTASILKAALAKDGGQGQPVTTLTPGMLAGEETGEEKTKDKGGKKSIAKKWWFWVALTAGAGVIAGVGYLGYAGSHGQLGGGGPGGAGGSGDIVIEF